MIMTWETELPDNSLRQAGHFYPSDKAVLKASESVVYLGVVITHVEYFGCTWHMQGLTTLDLHFTKQLKCADYSF